MTTPYGWHSWPVTVVTIIAFQNVTSFVYRAFLILCRPGKTYAFPPQPLGPSQIWAINIQTGLLALKGRGFWNSHKTRLCIACKCWPRHLTSGQPCHLHIHKPAWKMQMQEEKNTDYDKPLISILPILRAPRLATICSTVDLRKSCHSLLFS